MLVKRMNWSKSSLTLVAGTPFHVLSSLDKCLTVQGVAPHSFDNAADISSEVELVPELRVTPSHFDICRQLNLDAM
jgi:hypothetical protein